MLTLREALLFLAGAEAFHTLAHVWLGVTGAIPMELKVPHLTLTAKLNTAGVVVNALITVALVWWAMRL